MKRFVILLLVLLALTATQGAVEAAQKQACVCANGEKNCPCLAQRDPGVKLSGSLHVGDTQFHLSAESRSLKFGMTTMKKEEKVVESPVRAKGAVRIHKKRSYLYKRIPLAFKYKTVAPEERKRLIVLKNKMKAIKARMKQLRVIYKRASLAQKKELVVKRQLLKKSRITLKKQVKMLKTKLHTLVKQHFETCVRKTIERAKEAAILIVKLKKEIRLLIKKKEQLKNLIRISPQPHAAALCGELKKVKIALKHKKNKVLLAKKFVLKVKAAHKKAMQKKLAHAVHRKDRKLNHLMLKYKKLAAKIATLKKRQQSLKAKLLLQKSSLRESHDEPNRRLALELQIRHKTARLLKLVAKRKDLVQLKMKLRKRIQPLVSMVTKARKAIKKMKASSKCLGLQMKLSRELLRVKKLNEKFNRECNKAIKSKSKGDIKKALQVKIKINKIKTAITKIKGHIRRVPLRRRQGLKKKEEKLLVKLHMLQIDLKKAKAKATSVKLRCDEATGEKREGLEKKRIELMNKIVKIKHLIIDTKKGILLLKTTHRKDCEEAIVKEKSRSKELIVTIKRKLILAHKLAVSLHKALKVTRELARIKAAADQLKHDELKTEDKVLQLELRRKRAELKAKMVELKKTEMHAKLKSKRLQQELDQKSKAQLMAEKAVAKKHEAEIEAQMQDSIAKEEALRKALAKAHDEATTEALKSQHAAEMRRLNALNVRLKESQEARKALALEFELLKKMQLERREEARLQRAIVLKTMRKKALRLKAEFDVKASSRKTVQTSALKTKLLSKLNALMAKYHQAKLNFQAYSTALQSSNKKKISAVLLALKTKYVKKIKALELLLKKEQASQHAYKVKMMKVNSDRLLNLLKKLHADSDAKQLAYKKKIEAATAKGQALIKAAKLKSKVEIDKLKTAAKKKMMIIKGQINAIKAKYSKAEEGLNKKILKQEKRRSALNADIAFEKTRTKQRKQAHKAWMAKHKTNVEQLLNTEKAASTKELEGVKSTIAKTKATIAEKEANLKAKLKAALQEIENHKKTLSVEVNNYKRLKADMIAWTANQKIKLKTEVNKELAVRKAQAATMEARMKVCRDKIAETKATQLKLESDIERKSNEITEIHEATARQAKAQAVIVKLEGKLMASSTEIIQLRKTIDETCDGSDGTEASCQEFRSGLALIMQKSSDLKSLLTEEREKFFKLH